MHSLLPNDAYTVNNSDFSQKIDILSGFAAQGTKIQHFPHGRNSFKMGENVVCMTEVFPGSVYDVYRSEWMSPRSCSHSCG